MSITKSAVRDMLGAGVYLARIVCCVLREVGYIRSSTSVSHLVRIELQLYLSESHSK
jgi:hypothetical protein